MRGVATGEGSEAAAEGPRPGLSYDGHVHLVGNGRAGSGCWMRLAGWHRWMGGLMRRSIGMPVAVDHPDFDEIYVGRLAGMVRESGLDRALLLAQDEVYGADGRRRDFGSFHVPNEHLFAVCRAHPEFVPAVSVHPARRDALEELERCLAEGARALKLLPNCHGVDCGDPRHDRFWERMAEAGLPLLAHTGGEVTVPVVNRAFQNPALLRRPLEIGVTVVAAHCATASQVVDRDYLELLERMMGEFPRLHADTSALNTPFRSKALRRVLASPWRERLVHGSDFPVPVSAWPARLRGLLDGEAARRAGAPGNPIERDHLLKREMGFEDAHFRRWDALLRRID